MVVLACMVGLIVAALLWASLALYRRVRASRLLRQPAAPIAGLRRGELVRVEGRVVIDDTPLLRSPIEGKACVGYYLGVDYFDTSRHHVPQWFPVTEETVISPFRIIGDDGTVLDVDADTFDLELHFVESGRVLDPPAERVRPVLRRNGDYRLEGARLESARLESARFKSARNLAYVEVAIEPGARVSLIGRVLRPASSGAGAYRRSIRGAQLGPLREGEAIRLQLA